MKFKYCAFALFTASLFLFSACKKKDSNTSGALVVLNFHSIFGSDSISLGTTYRTSLGRNISFSRISYYISEINLIGTDNSVQNITGQLLINPQTLQYTAGAISPGSYKSISFAAGIDSTEDYYDPSTFPAGSPLAAQNPSMHFSNDTLGYIFMAVEGLYDSSAAGTGTPNTAFSYHLGTAPLLRVITMPDHSVSPYTSFTAAAGQLINVYLESDLSVLLNNIDVKGNPTTNTTDYPVVADSLANHIPGMFKYGR
jgi:hypothetical protein